VRRTIEEYGSHEPANGRIDPKVIIDPGRDHREAMLIGQDGRRRVHGCVVHPGIRGGEVWVRRVGTNRPIAEAPVDAVIPREEVVLGFHPVEARRHADHAAGRGPRRGEYGKMKLHSSRPLSRASRQIGGARHI